jgi:hypothetical protein
VGEGGPSAYRREGPDISKGNSRLNSHGEHVTTISGDFRGHHEEWTVTVDSLWGIDSSAVSMGTQASEPKQAREAGPWTFKFLTP